VPQDFLTDYASVPRLVGMYLLFGNKGKRAALIHDWLYSGGVAGITRQMADDVFKEALGVSGYSAFTIEAMYLGVRVGGAKRFAAPNLAQEPHVEGVMGAGALEAA
jgi:hypothetical protein